MIELVRVEVFLVRPPGAMDDMIPEERWVRVVDFLLRLNLVGIGEPVISVEDEDEARGLKRRDRVTLAGASFPRHDRLRCFGSACSSRLPGKANA